MQPLTEISLESRLVVERYPLDERWQMAVVVLNRPEQMNAIDWEQLLELEQIFDQLAEEPEVRVVAITGTGSSFSAGGDMERYRSLQRDPTKFPAFLERCQDVFYRMTQYPKPYIALVNGVAVAGGLELILHCDVAIASQSARMGDAHLVYGQVGGGAVLSLLPRLVGPNRARELILSGRTLTAEEALEWGIVSQVVPDEELIEAGLAFARQVAAKSPLGVAHAKRVLNTSFWEGTGIRNGARLELEVVTRYCLTSRDAPEGLLAFADKRKPNFTGE